MPRRGAVAATLDLIAMHLSIHRRHALAALAALANPALPANAQAPAFPQHPITLLLPFGPGGIADLTARAVAQGMAASLGQPLLIDNRPSAGSIVASQAVAAATPDGHTLLLMSNGHAVAASLFRKLPFDAQKDFAPVVLLARFDLALFVAAGARLPEVPTVAEAGGAALQRYDVSSWNALAAPARTPPEVLAQLNRAANEALAQPALQRQLRALGVRPQCGTPEQLRQWLASATRHWAEVVRGARIELQ